jgi:uncharacterized protein (DUF427 family)
MKRAEWNGAVLAESDDIVNVEGNAYFPEQSLRREFFQPSETHTVCPWKGTASYYSISVDGQQNRDAAWYYPQPFDAARQIKGRVAFWRGVVVRDV